VEALKLPVAAAAVAAQKIQEEPVR